MPITHPLATRFMDESLRPTVERMDNLYYILKDLQGNWAPEGGEPGVKDLYGGAKLTENLTDGRAAVGDLPDMSGQHTYDSVAVIDAVVAAMEAAGARLAIRRPKGRFLHIDPV